MCDMAHPSSVVRPVLMLGVDAPNARCAALHDMIMTWEYYDALPVSVWEHLGCRTLETLVPMMQKHDIKGLVMGVEEAALSPGQPL